MAYDPSADRPPSPVETWELYEASRRILLGSGAFHLGNPGDTEVPDPDKLCNANSGFYGFPDLSEGKGTDIGKAPYATHPPTLRLRFGSLALLHDLLPEARGVLGVTNEVAVVYHYPYISYHGGEPPPPHTRPNPADIGLILSDPDAPAVPPLARRVYRVTQESAIENHARGTRIDRLASNREEVLRTEGGMLPLLTHTEWQALISMVDCLSLLEPNGVSPKYT